MGDSWRSEEFFEDEMPVWANNWRALNKIVQGVTEENQTLKTRADEQAALLAQQRVDIDRLICECQALRAKADDQSALVANQAVEIDDW